MKHLDLFSGIGGFALAVDRVWPNSTHIFCEVDTLCQLVLKKHWPNSKIYGDIRTLTANAEHKRELQSQGGGKQKKRKWSSNGNIRNVDILTGGFPCQPFSQAGRRRGTEDDRHLWPEMLRVIREFHPRWVIGENVGGFVTWSNGLVLEQVHADLESEGYSVQAFIIPACAVNAPHRRDRVWIVANSQSIRSRGGSSKKRGDERKRELVPQKQKRNSLRGESERRTGWGENWLEVANRLCRVDDGLPKRLDRNFRLKTLGNAIVPQVAEEIMRNITTIDKNI